MITEVNSEQLTVNGQRSTVGSQQLALPVMETFYSLQGEGFHQGKAAYFIRLGGCDVGCHWCDVKESWDASHHPEKEIDQLVQEASAFPGKIAVITGGEPLMYNLQELTEALAKKGLRRH